MKRLLSALLALSIMVAVAVPAFAANKARTPERFTMLLDDEFYNWNTGETETVVYRLTFEECYGTIDYPSWGPIPVVKEGSKMKVEFAEGDIGKTFHESYPMRKAKDYLGNDIHEYYDPATNESVREVLDLKMNYHWNQGEENFHMLGTDDAGDDVASGYAFGVVKEGEYWYRMYNGFKDYKFDTVYSDHYLTLDMPSLYYAIGINDNQIKQFMNTGVITFPAPAGHPDYYTWSCTFPKSNMRAILMEGYNLVDYHAPSSWAAENATRADEIEITGDLVDYFGNTYYQRNITRGEFASVIINTIKAATDIDTDAIAENAVRNQEVEFFDVYYSDNVGPEIFAAAAMGIVNGVGYGDFAPENFVTRQEIAVMIHRALKYIETNVGGKYVTGASTDTSAYSDSAKIASWAKEGVGALVNLGIINGVTATEISPLTNTTTEQAITLALRVFDLISK